MMEEMIDSERATVLSVVSNAGKRNHEITKSRNHEITKSRNHEITKSRNHEITKSRNHEITKFLFWGTDLQPS